MTRGRASKRTARRWRNAGAMAVLALLLLPGAASAAPITVNSTGDTAANDGTCTLREAITSANTNTASGGMANECAAGDASDVIGFSAAFNGQLADTVAVGSALPAITTDTDIAGGQCMTDAGVNGPCAGVNGPSGNFGLVVDNVDSTSVSGVAATGALTGIDVIDSVSGFSATDDWLGVKLDGSAGANNTGLFIDPNSSNAQIGDATAAGRNVFAFNNNEGLDIEGADNNTIEGNYFGVKPNGTTQGSNAVDIEITGTENSGGIDATGNVVGGTLNAGQAATPACDGPCNVIDDAGSFGIDLNGNLAIENERPASLTSVKGNLVGLDATGAGEIPNPNVGIEMGRGDDTTVGGPSALDANHIVGGAHSIEARASGGNQLIQNNLVGLNYAGTGEATSPVPSGSHGILVVALGTGNTTVTQNRIAGHMDDPIETQGSPVLVSDNLIGLGTGGESLQGGITGIDVVVGSATNGSTYTGNFIQNSSDSGIELQGANGATITGNTILASAGTAGIWAHEAFGTTFSDDNTIGGDTSAEENVISGSNGPAIVVVEPGNTRNVVARNTGSGNNGQFIDLGDDGLGNALSGPNGGIQAPVIGFAQPSSASGTAQPGATVMAFSKASADGGEIAGFLGSAVADPSGNWQLSYGSPVAVGSSVGASQTTGAAGTSELAVATTADQTGAESPPPPDTDAPETTITKGPKKRSTHRKAKFRFSSNEPGSTFQCKLDRKGFKACRSPRTYKVKPGKHTFRVKAIDPSGNVGGPATRKFRVLAGG